MVHPDLVDYIQKAKQSGKSDADIASTLRQLGWGQVDVADSFEAASPSLMLKLRRNWKWVAIWVVIFVLFVVVCMLVYMVAATPAKK